MKKVIFSVAMAMTLAGFTACNSDKQEDSKEVAEEQNDAKLDETTVEDDSKFAVAAADGGLFEVQLGELAQKNGASAAVKDFGKTMVTDHGKANEELKALAAQKNITLPMSLSDDKQKKYDEFAEKKGADFDKAYISFMVDDHKKDISEFEKAAKDADDADIKAWAGGKIPTLQHHLEMAQTTKDAMK